jgi:hypothetical protein
MQLVRACGLDRRKRNDAAMHSFYTSSSKFASPNLASTFFRPAFLASFCWSRTHTRPIRSSSASGSFHRHTACDPGVTKSAPACSGSWRHGNGSASDLIVLKGVTLIPRRGVRLPELVFATRTAYSSGCRPKFNILCHRSHPCGTETHKQRGGGCSHTLGATTKPVTI